MANQQPQNRADEINRILAQLNTHRDPVMFGEELDDDFEMDTYITGNTWFKKDGKWMKNENGVTTEVPVNADRYINTDCRLFLNGANDDMCTVFLKAQQEIIENDGNHQNQNGGNYQIGGDRQDKINALIDDLANYMSRNYDAFKTTVKQLHPYFVLLMLKSFGFTINSETGEINSVSYWIRNTLPTYVADEGRRRRILDKSTKILDFLNILVHYINANSGILNTNKGYDVNTYETMARKAAGEELPNINGKDQVYNIRFTNYSEALRYLQASIKNNMRRFNINPLLYMRPHISGLYVPGMFGMFGGANGRYAANPTVQVGGVVLQYQVQQLNNPENINCGTKYANMMYNRLTSKLAAGNKKLHSRDEAHFKNLIQNLKTYEDRLYKFLSNFGNYVENGGQYSTNSNVVNSGEMKRFVDGLRLRGINVWNQEGKIVNALLRIANYVDSLPMNQGPAGNYRVNEAPIPLM